MTLRQSRRSLDAAARRVGSRVLCGPDTVPSRSRIEQPVQSVGASRVHLREFRPSAWSVHACPHRTRTRLRPCSPLPARGRGEPSGIVRGRESAESPRAAVAAGCAGARRRLVRRRLAFARDRWRRTQLARRARRKADRGRAHERHVSLVPQVRTVACAHRGCLSRARREVRVRECERHRQRGGHAQAGRGSRARRALPERRGRRGREVAPRANHDRGLRDRLGEHARLSRRRARPVRRELHAARATAAISRGRARRSARGARA